MDYFGPRSLEPLGRGILFESGLPFAIPGCEVRNGLFFLKDERDVAECFYRGVEVRKERVRVVIMLQRLVPEQMRGHEAAVRHRDWTIGVLARRAEVGRFRIHGDRVCTILKPARGIAPPQGWRLGLIKRGRVRRSRTEFANARVYAG